MTLQSSSCNLPLFKYLADVLKKLVKFVPLILDFFHPIFTIITLQGAVYNKRKSLFYR